MVRAVRQEAPYWAAALPQLPRLVHRVLAEDRLAALRAPLERLAGETARRNDLLGAILVIAVVGLILLAVSLF